MTPKARKRPSCLICSGPDVEAIDGSLAAGLSRRAIAMKFRVGKDVVARHASHRRIIPRAALRLLAEAVAALSLAIAHLEAAQDAPGRDATPQLALVAIPEPTALPAKATARMVPLEARPSARVRKEPNPIFLRIMSAAKELKSSKAAS